VIDWDNTLVASSLPLGKYQNFLEGTNFRIWIPCSRLVGCRIHALCCIGIVGLKSEDVYFKQFLKLKKLSLKYIP
jgi:hypothetical protein